jgi:hypothetical protein
MDLKIEVLHVRDPDSECGLEVFVNGESVGFDYEDVDPGRGYSREDWDERIEENEAALVADEPTRSPGFRRAIDLVLRNSDTKYIY